MANYQQTIPYRRVYVWELPVRIYHWINALCILLLVVTGYLIGNPQAVFSAEEPYQQHWFGIIRFIHFATAYIFFFNFLFRVYWSIAGNEYASWRNYLPYRREQFKELWEVILVDILQIKTHGKISVGHNVLASFTYFVSFLIFLFMTATGFGLYAATSDSFFPQLFAWVVPLMGGDAYARQWHHIGMWFYIVFVIIHVYLAAYHDYVEGRGTMSSIFGGWKFERDDEIETLED